MSGKPINRGSVLGLCAHFLFRFVNTVNTKKVDFAAFYRLTQLRQRTIDSIDQLNFFGSVNSTRLQERTIDLIDRLDRFRGLLPITCAQTERETTYHHILRRRAKRKSYGLIDQSTYVFQNGSLQTRSSYYSGLR